MARKPKNAAKKTVIVTELETGMIAFRRSIQVSEGVFFGIKENKDGEELRIHIPVMEKGVRGQSSEDAAKNAGKSSPQVVDYAAVPQECNSIELYFNARVHNSGMAPYATDDKTVFENYRGMMKNYVRLGGMRVLAELYTWNIANGRFAWRNRFQTDDAIVSIEFNNGNTRIEFRALELDLERPNSIDDMAAAMANGSKEDLEDFIDQFATALSTPEALVFNVTWRAKMLPGQEVFPSQEYIRESIKENLPSRVYAKIPVWTKEGKIDQASMHSQKINAAIRHIDVWHEKMDEFGAIAINPYGGVQEIGDAVRGKNAKDDMYSIRSKGKDILETLEIAQTLTDIPTDDMNKIHFLVANIIRGGVFGKKSEEKKAEEQAAGNGSGDQQGDENNNGSGDE